jgi:hypothetical protein
MRIIVVLLIFSILGCQKDELAPLLTPEDKAVFVEFDKINKELELMNKFMKCVHSLPKSLRNEMGMSYCRSIYNTKSEENRAK